MAMYSTSPAVMKWATQENQCKNLFMFYIKFKALTQPDKGIAPVEREIKFLQDSIASKFPIACGHGFNEAQFIHLP